LSNNNVILIRLNLANDKDLINNKIK